jgi:hypothetical protein
MMHEWDTSNMNSGVKIFVHISLVHLPEAVASDGPALLQAHVLGSPLLDRIATASSRTAQSCILCGPVTEEL